MKLLITTRADSGIQDWIDISHPIFKKYAKKVGADFIVLDHVTDCETGDGRWHYRIMKHYDLHEDYDRILHLDTDILLTPQCPNIFEIVPYDCIGVVLEDKGSRAHARFNSIISVQKKFGDIGWRSGYINTGTFLTSKCHKDIYQKINGEYWMGWGSDDVHLAYLIHGFRYKIFELPYQFNHMTMFSDPWNGNKHRYDSYAIHYAGKGIFDPSIADNKLDHMRHDYNVLYEKCV